MQETQTDSTKPSIAGVAWFRRDDYDALKTLFTDGPTFFASYDDWLQAAERLLEKFRSRGVEAHKVYIDPKEFPVWCAANGMDIDSKARIRFANEAVARMYFDRNR